MSQMNKIVAEEHPRPLEKNQSSPLPPLPHSARRAEEQKDTRVKAVPAAAKEEQVNVLPPILASPRVPAPAPSGLPVSSPSATAALVALCKASDWNPDPQRMQPLIVSGGADVFHLVEEGEVIPGTLNWPLFHLLVFKGRVEAVKACLSSKLPMDFTIRDEHYGRTPLHRACEACLSHEVSRQMLVAMARRLQNHPEDTVNWNQCDDFELTVVQSAANHQKLCLLWQLLGTEFAGVYDAHGNDEENTQRRRRRERRMASTPKNTSATEDPRRPSSLSSSSSVLLSSGLIPDAAPRPRERTGGAFPPRPPAGATPPSGMSAVVSGNHLPHSHSHSHSHHHRHQLRMSSSLTGHQAMGNGNEGFHYTVVSTSLQLDPERYGFLNLDGPIPLDTVWRWEWEALTAAGATRRYFKVKKNRIIDADEPTGELWRLATHHPQTAPASAIEALVSVGADVVFLKDNITILHRFIRAGAVNAVRACLQTQRHIDFTVKNDFLWTLFHSGVSPVTRAHRRDVSHVMMCAILDRLESHPGDGVDWSGTNCAGDNLLSTAAAYGKLSLLWNLLISRRIPYFHNYPGRIPITTKVYKKDWDQLSDEHQSRFNLIEGFETEELVSE